MRLPGIDQVPEWMATDLANLKIPGSSPGLGKFFFFFFSFFVNPKPIFGSLDYSLRLKKLLSSPQIVL